MINGNSNLNGTRLDSTEEGKIYYFLKSHIDKSIPEEDI